MAAAPRGGRAARRRSACRRIIATAAAALCLLQHVLLRPRSLRPCLAAAPGPEDRGAAEAPAPPAPERPHRLALKEELSSLKVNDQLEGRVAWTRGNMGVFIDVGATAYARLGGDNTYLASRLRRHDVLGGLRVVHIDLERNSIDVTCDHLEHYVANRVLPVREMEVGDVVDGRVVDVKDGIGAFIDVGCEKEALLAGPRALVEVLEADEVLRGLIVKYVNPVVKLFGLDYSMTEGVKEGDIVKGKVVKVVGEVVTVDLGGRRVARLFTPNNVAFTPKVGEVLEGLRVLGVNEERNQISVVINKFEEHLTPLSFFARGDVVDGTVYRVVDGSGIFVDIGAVRSARLDFPRRMQTSDFKEGQFLKGLRVKYVDTNRSTIGVGLPDVQGEGEDEVLRGEVVRVEGDDVFLDIGKGREARLHTAREVPFRPSVGEVLEGLQMKQVGGETRVTLKNVEDHLTPLSAFTPGDAVDGRVYRVLEGAGVFVDIGATRGAFLMVPKERRTEFREDQILKGLVVCSVNKKQIAVKLPPRSVSTGAE